VCPPPEGGDALPEAPRCIIAAIFERFWGGA